MANFGSNTMFTCEAICWVQCNGAPLCDSKHSLIAASSSYGGNNISEVKKPSATPLIAVSSFYTLSCDTFFSVASYFVCLKLILFHMLDTTVIFNIKL